MNYSDFPCLFQKSDTASLDQQKWYMRSIKFEFVLIVVAALTSSFPMLSSANISYALSITTAIAVLLAFISRTCQLILKWDRKWFDTRAIAESAKTSTWRYLMAADPYIESLAQKDVDKKFVDEMDEIFKARPEAHSSISEVASLFRTGKGSVISDALRLLA